MDLALVEEDLGREVALEAARHLVVFLQRPGGQAQFSAQLAAQTADRAPLREDLSIPALTRRVCMSDRNFARAFRRETGETPGAYVEAARRTALGSRSRRATSRPRRSPARPASAPSRRCGARSGGRWP